MPKREHGFKDQGGVATMDPSALRRWIMSKVMSAQADENRMHAKRNKAERKRVKAAQGNLLREQLKHYLSAMFYYAGEWYWGVDRLYHLEKRLREVGADKNPEQSYLLTRPSIEPCSNPHNVKLTLEIFASLRSPYTAMVFDRAVQLAEDNGINCVVRPVLPMVMRGVPATKEKGLYILFDAAREARAAGVDYRNIYDPIGQPARQGYALHQWACKSNKGTEFSVA
jgi:2-hydroxychromene-2-carboxylate isomerase